MKTKYWFIHLSSKIPTAFFEAICSIFYSLFVSLVFAYLTLICTNKFNNIVHISFVVSIIVSIWTILVVTNINRRMKSHKEEYIKKSIEKLEKEKKTDKEIFTDKEEPTNKEEFTDISEFCFKAETIDLDKKERKWYCIEHISLYIGFCLILFCIFTGFANIWNHYENPTPYIQQSLRKISVQINKTESISKDNNCLKDSIIILNTRIQQLILETDSLKKQLAQKREKI